MEKKKGPLNNNTTIFSGVAAFLAWALVNVAEFFIPEFIQGNEIEWTAGLTLVIASIGRQLKYHLKEKGSQ